MLGVILALALLAIPALAVDGSPVSSEADLQAAAASGGSYYLADDIKLTEVLNVGTTLTLDLNGHTVEQTGSRTIDWCETDNLPWDDQYDDEAYGCVKGQRQQNLSAICLRGGANLTVNATGGGEIVSKNNGIDYNYTEAAQGMTLVVNGAEITGANYAIYSVDDEVDVTISGGICNGKVGASLITGGEFNGFTEVETAVTGGIFNGELKIGGLDEISNCTINGVLIGMIKTERFRL